MRRALFAAWLAAAGVMAGPAAAAGPLPPGGDFTLTGANGAPFRLSGLRGKAVLLFFGYTSCAEACPMMMSRVNAVFERLGRDRDRAQAVFVSVDPARDTPPVLRDYLSYFSARTVAVTGTRAQLGEVASRYGVPFEIVPSGSALGYTVSHGTDLYVIGPDGKLHSRLAHTQPTARIVAAIHQALHAASRE